MSDSEKESVPIVIRDSASKRVKRMHAAPLAKEALHCEQYQGSAGALRLPEHHRALRLSMDIVAPARERYGAWGARRTMAQISRKCKIVDFEGETRIATNIRKHAEIAESVGDTASLSDKSSPSPERLGTHRTWGRSKEKDSRHKPNAPKGGRGEGRGWHHGCGTSPGEGATRQNSPFWARDFP